MLPIKSSCNIHAKVIYRWSESAKFLLATCSTLFSRKRVLNTLLRLGLATLPRTFALGQTNPRKKLSFYSTSMCGGQPRPLPLLLTFLYIFCNLNFSYCCMFQRSFHRGRPELVLPSGGLNKYLTAQLQPAPQQQCMLVYPAYYF